VTSRTSQPDTAPFVPAGDSPDPWEAAYLRFQTPEQEIRKFVKRLRKLHTDEWPRETEIVELFCGRGNGLVALERLGFSCIEGVDISPRLVARYHGPASLLIGDCRRLPFADQSKDVLMVQGGLHHLPALPDDLEQVLSEMHRIVRRNGRVVIIEPWNTSFLKIVHAVSHLQLARRISSKLDALEAMIENEWYTYQQWLGQPEMISRRVRAHFDVVQESFAWGKWSFLGRPL